MTDARDYMKKELPLCTPLTSIENIKKLMAEKTTDEVLVVDSLQEKHLLGTININDILAKTLGQKILPSELNAEQCIRPFSVTVREDASAEECKRIMSINHLSKVAVIDGSGHVCGVIESANLMGH